MYFTILENLLIKKYPNILFIVKELFVDINKIIILLNICERKGILKKSIHMF